MGKSKEFEKVEKYIGVKHAIAINNELQHWMQCLRLNITKKMIIVPSLTYISTANVVSYKRLN